MIPGVESASADGVLVIERVFDAPRSLVFRIWTDPDHVKRWRGPRDFVTIGLEFDARPGGAWSIQKRTPSGGYEMAGGTFREVVPPERLVFTHAWLDAPWLDTSDMRGHETLVTVTFAEHDQGRQTHMTFRQEVFPSVEDRDSHVWGWSSSFDLLTEYLATA